MRKFTLCILFYCLGAVSTCLSAEETTKKAVSLKGITARRFTHRSIIVKFTTSPVKFKFERAGDEFNGFSANTNARHMWINLEGQPLTKVILFYAVSTDHAVNMVNTGVALDLLNHLFPDWEARGKWYANALQSVIQSRELNDVRRKMKTRNGLRIELEYHKMAGLLRLYVSRITY